MLPNLHTDNSTPATKLKFSLENTGVDLFRKEVFHFRCNFRNVVFCKKAEILIIWIFLVFPCHWASMSYFWAKSEGLWLQKKTPQLVWNCQHTVFCVGMYEHEHEHEFDLYVFISYQSNGIAVRCGFLRRIFLIFILSSIYCICNPSITPSFSNYVHI